MKKIISSFLTLITLFALTACNSSSTVTKEEETSKNTMSAEDSRTEITYWYAWGDKIGENNENLVKMFNESQDKIHVTAEFQGTYDELHAKTQAALAAKNAPEVTQNEIASIGIFAKSGMTQDLTAFAERDDIDIEDFNPGLMGNSYVDGKLYGLPYLRSTPILYMNATLLKEAGLDPTGPKDWAEFEEYLRVLTKGDMVGMSMPVNIWFYEAFVAQGEGQMLSDAGKTSTFNEEAGVEVLEFWQKLAKEGILKIPAGETAGDVAKQDFANGQAAMIFSSTADLSYQLGVSQEKGFELTTAFMPGNKVNGVPTGGANLVMTAGLEKEKQEAAWEFIKWMTAKEQTIYASKFTGYLPSRLSAIDSEEMQALYKERPQFKVAVDQLQYGHARPMAEAYPEISMIIMNEISRVLLEENYSAKEALDTAAEQADALLQK